MQCPKDLCITLMDADFEPRKHLLILRSESKFGSIKLTNVDRVVLDVYTSSKRSSAVLRNQTESGGAIEPLRAKVGIVKDLQ